MDIKTYAETLKVGLVVTPESLEFAICQTRKMLEAEQVPGVVIMTVQGMLLNGIAQDLEKLGGNMIDNQEN